MSGDEQVSYSNAGNNDALQEDFSVNLSIMNPKW